MESESNWTEVKIERVVYTNVKMHISDEFSQMQFVNFKRDSDIYTLAYNLKEDSISDILMWSRTLSDTEVEELGKMGINTIIVVNTLQELVDKNIPKGLLKFLGLCK